MKLEDIKGWFADLRAQQQKEIEKLNDLERQLSKWMPVGPVTQPEELDLVALRTRIRHLEKLSVEEHAETARLRRRLEKIAEIIEGVEKRCFHHVHEYGPVTPTPQEMTLREMKGDEMREICRIAKGIAPNH